VSSGGAFARRHALFLAILAAGVALRVLMHLAYPYPLFFPDSRLYVAVSLHWRPYQIRPFGYSFFLKPFVRGPLNRVVLVQHLMGLGLMVAGYAFLIRRGVQRWVAALATLPLAADAIELMLEHEVLAELPFLLLTCAGIFLLVWRPRMPVTAAVGAGLLFAAATLTRTVGAPLALFGLGYLVLRRAGWRQVAGFTIAVMLPLGGYLVWYHQSYGVYTVSQYQGRFLYGRVMTFADCGRLHLTAKQRTLCTTQPPSMRPDRPDFWVWSGSAANPASKYRSVKDDPLLNGFALAVIRQQPLDFLRTTVVQTSWHFWPRAPLSAETLCRNDLGQLPAQPGGPCQSNFYTPTRDPAARPRPPLGKATALRSAMSAYGHAEWLVRGPLLGLILLATLAAAFWQRRDDNTVDGLFIAGCGVGLLVASVATSMYEPRYSQPIVALIPIGAALVTHRLLSRRNPQPADPSSGSTGR
jgi:hypothetical protein